MIGDDDVTPWGNGSADVEVTVEKPECEFRQDDVPVSCNEIRATGTRCGTFPGQAKAPYPTEHLAVETDYEQRDEVEDQTGPSHQRLEHRETVTGNWRACDALMTLFPIDCLDHCEGGPRSDYFNFRPFAQALTSLAVFADVLGNGDELVPEPRRRILSGGSLVSSAKQANWKRRLS
jgi:hypothetical protein